jgi:cytochrome c-type biogenesis protein
VGSTFAGIATSGPIIVAIGVAALAGLVSFLSPCVLPLVPGYLSYMTGLAGADLDDALNRPTARTRGRITLGAGLFIAGFSAVFILINVVAAQIGRTLLGNARMVELIAGVLIIGLGLAFLGVIPGLQRELRPHSLPAAGLASAPILGAVFAISWIPCSTPTLAAVLTLSGISGSTPRAVTLAIAYCLGLGLPFLIFGLGFRKLIGVHRAIRRNSPWITRVGGALLIVVGLALATGLWDSFLIWLKVTVGPGSVDI